MAASSATYAFSGSPLSRAYRPFTGPILKGSSGSRVRNAGRMPRAHVVRRTRKERIVLASPATPSIRADVAAARPRYALFDADGVVLAAEMTHASAVARKTPDINAVNSDVALMPGRSWASRTARGTTRNAVRAAIATTIHGAAPSASVLATLRRRPLALWCAGRNRQRVGGESPLR